MERLIDCSTCGYPLTPEEREGLVEIDGKMCKPRKPLTEEHLTTLCRKHWDRQSNILDHITYARAIEALHQIGDDKGHE